MQPDTPYTFVARRFLDLYRRGIEPDLADIDRLAGAAVHDDRAVKALYGIVVEGLCDDFSPAGVALCNRVLLRILAVARRLPALAELDWALRDAGFETDACFLARYRRLAAVRAVSPPAVIVVLSRVTIGADVAVTSILLQRLRRRYPAAELVLVGPRHLEQLFAGIGGIRMAPLDYPRRGSLVARLHQCQIVQRIIRREAAMAGGPLVVVDPDSRLSQLGLQPFVPESCSWYFNSRAQGGEEDSLAELANRWLDDLCGPDEFAWPAVFPAEAHRRFAERLHRRLGRRPLCIVNFGVGGNPAKRIPDPFEERLVHTLIRRWPGVVLFDSGRSPVALERTRRLVQDAGRRGLAAAFVTEGEDDAAARSDARLVGFRGSIGAIAALLERAAAFVGYDSCCQHLAAAAGVAGAVVFAGALHERFRNRWRPANRHGTLAVIPVADGREMDLQAITNLVEDVAAAIGRVLAR